MNYRKLNKAEIVEYIETSGNAELKLLYKKRILRVVATEQLSVGIHFPQLGENAIRILRDIQSKNGYMIASRRNAAVMTDIVAIDRFHISKVTNKITAEILGIPEGSGYTAFHNLYRFLLAYKKDAAGVFIKGVHSGEEQRRGHPLQFLNYKDNIQYDVAIQNFVLKRSADDPMLYNYTITMRAYNLQQIFGGAGFELEDELDELLDEDNGNGRAEDDEEGID